MKDDHLLRLLVAEHHDPFQFLGVHETSPGSVVFRTFQPHAKKVFLLINNSTIPMTKEHSDGLFEFTILKSEIHDKTIAPYSYRYEILFFDDHSIRTNDPYRFLPIMDEFDQYLFNSGTNYTLYNHLGAHPKNIENIQGVLFRVWAPAAKAVSVIGDFNGWDNRVNLMRSLGKSGVWELFIPHIAQGELYRYSIKTQSGTSLEKSDPFQFFGELRPQTASIVSDLNHYDWKDNIWQEKKRSTPLYDKPVSIYEVHPGSWKRDPSAPDRFLTYHELADQLIPYVVELGFTHIELMPVMEHPLDESWGYQVTCPFSVTSRYGTITEFKYFVDQCHQHGVGVILDWVPAHFPRDSFSLSQFDGTALYEHEDPRKGAHPDWGTLIYNYGRSEVSNFLISNAMFWLEKYHIDGLRVDAVASMLYLDYGRKDGEWLPNTYGGRENLEAIEFLKHLNSSIYEYFPNTLMIAEESTSFYGVSKPTHQNGLGFGYKWNMGWMNDILSYFTKDPLYRKYHHNSLTFSIMYAFSENFVLPLSHDEVVHGKKSLLEKMPGDLWQKFANLRLLLLTMWVHPGKKLLFMGSEFGQLSEWYCKRSLDWHLLEKNNLHEGLFNFFKELNNFYVKSPALFEKDFDHNGFKWLDLADNDNSIVSFVRRGNNEEDHLVCILNFTPQSHQNYVIALPSNKTYRTIFCSNNRKYGGSDNYTPPDIKPSSSSYAQGDFSCSITIPPLAGIILKPLK